MTKEFALSSDRVFYNSNILLCQFYDIIASPYYGLIDILRQTEATWDIFDMSDIWYLDLNGLYEWYVYRKHRNPLLDLAGINEVTDVQKEMLDDLLLQLISAEDIYFEQDLTLNFHMTLGATAAHKNLVKSILIYEKEIPDNMRQWIESKYGDRVTLVDGDFGSILRSLPSNDITYVLSDVTLIDDIVKEDKLDMSSILLPMDYRYLKDHTNEKYLVDFHELGKEHIFKLNFFDNIRQNVVFVDE